MFAALPAELQRELKAAYDQRQRQGESSAHQPPAGAAGKLGAAGPQREHAVNSVIVVRDCCVMARIYAQSCQELHVGD